MLGRKRKRDELEQTYLTIQKLVKNKRENQKSHNFYKQQKSINLKTNSFFDSSRQNSPVVVVRISGEKERISKEIMEILKEFKLLKVYACVVLDYTKQNHEKLNIISSYVTWGFTNKKIITSLITKRGVVYDSGNKVLNELSNTEIEASLSKHNILCIEDLIHELSSPSSKKRIIAMGYLGFFLLSPCDDIKENTIIPYMKGGCSGFRDNINELLVKMI